jgi:3-phenylpropionate/trans-cinnamate dioxygenase ferredoxin component
MDPIRVGALVEIPEGEMRAYDVPAGRVSVAHDEQRLFAFDDVCPGESCSLSEGAFDDRTNRVTCATCESVFDVESGEPLEGPARDPLRLFTVREVDGWVEVSPYPVG